ncbi:N-methyl-L-tryptophan oxidase [Catellatospora sp. KI3]|uniref:N-methyl-L-tryptophan oxidase n=1 Tax=Catellatospora sp. KI3 TaxID=3041620 RepID=UPI00248283BA|nr:N-methyl-L-tryptophan oxidase [Catellatospora sp. KI3]MDI1464372.1 N-methyl-L-tryptophan oxidase [Catellatospora sp. KI3]
MTDLLVIGGGVTGAATALAAAARGLRTVLVERFPPGHRYGSSAGPSRIIRLAYDDPGYITLVRDADRRWRDLQQSTGVRLVTRTGGLDFGPAGLPSLRATAAAMASAGVPFTTLTGAELAERFPQLRPDPGMEGLYQPDAGVLHADDCVATLLAEAARHGAVIRHGARARDLRPDGDGVSATVDGQRLRAAAAVVAAGSWVNDVLGGTGVALPVTVTREQVGYYEVTGVDYTPARFPVTIEHQAARPYMISMFPELVPGGGIKLMRDKTGPEITPEDLSGEPDQAGLDLLTAHARRRLHGLGPLLHAETCRYTMTPDADFILDLLPGRPRIAVASACSGHGFKFAPTLGEIMVDLATTATTPHNLHPFRLDRLDR